jgi:bifunctional DNA-binding transcriptional regulator/antitoxin component of YhaV-PrlF toxin-antitoxin module
MSTVDVDSRGRVYLPKEIREKYGEEFKVVELESGVKLIPLDDDPIEGLKEAMEGAEDIDLGEISERAGEKAKEEAIEDL